MPWPRALHLVAHGKIDLILTLFKTEPREKIYHFIAPSYAYEANQLFVLANSDITYSGQLSDLSPFSIGTIREYSYGNDFDNASYLKKSQVLTEEVLLKQLLTKRTNMLISNPLTFKKIMQDAGAIHKLKTLEPYISLTPVYIALAKHRENAEEIKDTLSQLIQQLKSSAYYQELLEKYQLNYKEKN